MKQEQIGQVRVGDRAIAGGHRVGDATRLGEVLEVVGEPGHERCRIQWEDGHETFVYAGADVRFEHREPPSIEELG